jgi:hypothetical protein
MYGCFLATLENGASTAFGLVNFLGDLIVFLIVIGFPAFTRTYGRHRDLLTGPWITNENLTA